MLLKTLLNSVLVMVCYFWGLDWWRTSLTLFCGNICLSWWQMKAEQKNMIKGLFKLLFSLIVSKCTEKKIPQPDKIGNALRIYFPDKGEVRSVIVPYDETDTAKYMGKKVFMTKNCKKYEITQMVGIPYLISATDLEAEAISVFSIEDNEEQLFSGANYPIIN